MPSPAGCHRPACSPSGYEESNGGGVAAAGRVLVPARPAAPQARSAPAVELPALPDGAGVLILVNRTSGIDPRRPDPVVFLAQTLPNARVHVLQDGDDIARLVDEAAARRAGLALLVLPGGTFNHFARTAGIPTIDSAVDAVRVGAGRRVDVAELALGDRAPFTVLNATSLGVYADLVAEREPMEKALGKPLAALVAAIRVLSRAEAISVSVDGRTARVWSVAVAAGGNDSASMVPLQRRRLDDGVLDVRVLHAYGRRPRFRGLVALAFGARASSMLDRVPGRRGLRTIEAFTAESVRVDASAEGATSIGIAHDGEVTEAAPRAARVQPRGHRRPRRRRSGRVQRRGPRPRRLTAGPNRGTGRDRTHSDAQTRGMNPIPWVLHVDMDQFIAAVEVLRRPELAGRPVIVGGSGDPTERAVVSTASYEARAHGIGSGMPLKIAARKAPDDAVFLPVDHPAYEDASSHVMQALRDLSGVVLEVIGWDECFLGVSTDDPESVAREAQRAVHEATALHCSVGIGDNKVRAKIATGFGKPRGVFRLTEQNWFEVMGERSTRELWGVGPRVQKRLAEHGIRTVRELAEADERELVAEFGPNMGVWYHRLGFGHGPAAVDDTPWIARSHSRETTFQRNLTTRAQIAAAVAELARAAFDDCAAEGRPVVRVHLKVRYAPFETRTTGRRLAEPARSRDEFADAALALAETIEPGREVRLLGVRAEMTMSVGGATGERTPVRGRF